MRAWSGPEFRDALRDWVEDVAGPVIAMEPAKLRPWATVWRVRTEDGLLYAKQNCPGQSFEAALLAVLSEIAPSYVVPVTAVDTERGLLLTPDQGQVFGESVAADDLDSWCRLVARAMELARVVMPHAELLQASGLTTCRVPTQVAEHVRPCLEAVATLDLPDTLVHNDLHEHNAFDRPGGLIFFDFADAVLAHPLAGLLIPLEVLADRFGEPGPHDPRLQRVADAGLEVWSDLAPIRELRSALPAALRLGRLGRAESWARVAPDFTGQDAADWGGAAAAWLARLPDPVPVRFE
ncbi:MAG: hypothetical protein ACXWDL_09705 [Nocardioides sp.]